MRLLGSKEIVTELCCVLSWSADAQRAYAKALREYQRAGSPPMPLGSRDYRTKWKKKRRNLVQLTRTDTRS